MEASGFYDAGRLKQVAVNLFYGWGYNFYRQENQLRTDDQLIRAKAGSLLGDAHRSVDAAESEYRREKLPHPSRANPYPDALAVDEAQRLERLGNAIGSLIGRLHALPVPENDRMTQRFRSEVDTLKRLIECDERLIGQCDVLRETLKDRRGAWLIDNIGLVTDGIAAIEATMDIRKHLLM